MASGLTDISSGLLIGAREFNQNGRRGVRKLMILISDGGDLPYLTLPVADAIKNNGIQICSIILRTGDTNLELMQEVSSDNCYTISSYQELVMELKALSICL